MRDEICSKKAWKSVRNVLGIKKIMSPTAIKDSEGALVINPSKLANQFNEFIIEKVRLLREKTNSPPSDKTKKVAGQVWETTPTFNLERDFNKPA